jgi:CheY-like chemotaxis protein
MLRCAVRTTVSKLSILYLDDSESALRAVTQALGEAGFEVRTAGTPDAACTLVRKADLVIIDYHLAGSDGAAAARQLRASPGLDPKAPFYLYTSDTTVASSFKELGFDGALTQKGNLEALVRQVQSIAKIMEMRRFVRDRKR